jgi:mannitol-1-phosphate 5-dehydrogenase
MSNRHRFVGFGFGPIQATIFSRDAIESGHFDEVVVAEIDADLVSAVRGNQNRYTYNVASADGRAAVTVEGVELLNPQDAGQSARLKEILGRSTEVVTALPSVAFYDRGKPSVAARIAGALKAGDASATAVYTAENHNHAAEILDEKIAALQTDAITARPMHCLNTVIGKMSRVVTGPGEMADLQLEPLVPGMSRALLVEAFHRILVSRTRLPDFSPGIQTLIEKDDLLPFEEAKLYGHNAIHALLGFVGAVLGVECLTDLREVPRLMEIAESAFIDEIGAALIAKYGDLDEPLFTSDGFREYAEDLLQRITNPFLVDTVARAIRDPLRKLSYTDRLLGAMRLCLSYGVEPRNLAVGAAAGIRLVANEPGHFGLECERHAQDETSEMHNALLNLGADAAPAEELDSVVRCILQAREVLNELT